MLEMHTVYFVWQCLMAKIVFSYLSFVNIVSDQALSHITSQ